MYDKNHRRDELSLPQCANLTMLGANVIPQELVDIQKFLSANVVQLSKKFQDGRINASINEDEILQVIDANFDIELPPPVSGTTSLSSEARKKSRLILKLLLRALRTTCSASWACTTPLRVSGQNLPTKCRGGSIFRSSDVVLELGRTEITTFLSSAKKIRVTFSAPV